MSDDETLEIKVGIAEQHRAAAAELYDQAFGDKLKVAIADKTKRLIILRAGFNLDFAVGAVRNGQLIGIAGLKTKQGALTGGINAKIIFGTLGILRGLWAGLILAMYIRELSPGQLLMDGLSVSADARGEGVGSGLLKQVIAHGRNEGYRTVRLDVIDTNPRAKKLYERIGFATTDTSQFGYLRWLLGFGGSATMEYAIKKSSQT